MGQCMSSTALDGHSNDSRYIGDRREQKKKIFITDPYMHQLIEESNQKLILEQEQQEKQKNTNYHYNNNNNKKTKIHTRRGQTHLLYNKKQQQQQQQQQNYHYDSAESEIENTPTFPDHYYYQHAVSSRHETQSKRTTTKLIRRIRRGTTFYTSNETQLEIEADEQGFGRRGDHDNYDNDNDNDNEEEECTSGFGRLKKGPGVVHIYAIREDVTSKDYSDSNSDTSNDPTKDHRQNEVKQEQRPVTIPQQQQLSSSSSSSNSLDNVGEGDEMKDPIDIISTSQSQTNTTSTTFATKTKPLPTTTSTTAMMNTNPNNTGVITNPSCPHGMDIFTSQAMSTLPNPPPNAIEDWVCVSSKHQIYICDTGLSIDHCHRIVYQTEQACRGQYNAYTYAKQTLGCREFPTLALGCLEPVHKVCHAIITRLGPTTSTSDDENENQDNEEEKEEEKEEHESEEKENTSKENNDISNSKKKKKKKKKKKRNVTLILDDREPHMVKYDVTKKERQKLDMHTDKSEWTFLIALSDGCGWDYDGGGTYFEGLDATVHLQRGHCLIFPGKLRHCGQKITKGLRFLLVGFLVDQTQSQSNLALAAAAAAAKQSTITTKTATKKLATTTSTAIVDDTQSNDYSKVRTDKTKATGGITTMTLGKVGTDKNHTIAAKDADDMDYGDGINGDDDDDVDGSCCGFTL